MGHVDHGKTRLLDAIRQAKVMESEVGGITQHIGAYQVDVDGQKITFLDTPGHEAFTAMRAHGAQVTDITVLVVAADDGVMPQTKEAIDHAKAAGVPIVVAINKIDKPEANPDRVKQQLADAGLVIEEYGGQTVAVETSAKAGKGVPELLENILLVAELEELKANPSQSATGVVIEARMDKSMGSMATVLVHNGTLRIGDTIVAGTTWGRVKAMFNEVGKRIRKAEPATPAAILGLGSVPGVGDTLRAVAGEHQARDLAERRKNLAKKSAMQAGVSLTNIYDQISAGKMKELNIILKTDVQGSIEPIRASLEGLGTEKVQVRIIHSGAGNVTESDVMLAAASKGLVVGFGTGIEAGAQRSAEAEGVDIRRYEVIYSLVEDVEKAIKGLLEPEYRDVVDGRAEVKAVFTAGKRAKVAGVAVTEGKVASGAMVRVKRGEEVLVESSVASLKRFKDNVKEVAAGFEAGVGVKDFSGYEVGDILEFYRREKVS
jgi:translation initiation factor IF-2